MIAKRRNLYVLECKLQLPIFVLLYLSYSMDRVYIGVENSDGSISDIPIIASRRSDFALRAIAMLAQQQQQQQQPQQQQQQVSSQMDRVYCDVEYSDGSISDIPIIASRRSDFALRAIAMLAQQQQQQQQQPQQQQAFEPEPEMDPGSRCF